MKRILIADDEPHISRVLRLVLENEGYEVECADNGQIALEMFHRQLPDVLIADIRMPVLDGKELASRVRENRQHDEILIIMMTSSLENRYQDWLQGMPNTCFVGKPVSPRELVTKINGYFSGAGDNGDDYLAAAI